MLDTVSDHTKESSGQTPTDADSFRRLVFHGRHKSDVNYSAYLTAILAVSEASERAVSFLDDLVQNTQCDSLAFMIFESLIKDISRIAEVIVEEGLYNTWCPNGRNAMQGFLLVLTDNLLSIRQPFSSTVEELARRDSGFRCIFAWIGRQSCCNTIPCSHLSYEQHFLLNQILIFAPDEQPPFQNENPPLEMTSTCDVCFDQDAKQIQLAQECEHEGTVCLECLAQAIAAQLDCKRWNELTCPLCPAKLDSNTIERYASEETVQRLLIVDIKLGRSTNIVKIPIVHDQRHVKERAPVPQMFAHHLPSGSDP